MKRSSLVLALLAVAAIARAQDGLVSRPGLDLSAIRRLVVLEGERYKPLDSMAREWVERITGKEVFRDTDPVLLFLFLRFEPEKARATKLIKLPKFRAASSIAYEPKSLEDEHVTWDDLDQNPLFQARVKEIMRKKSDAWSLDEREILDLHTRWSMFAAFAGLDTGWSTPAAPELSGLLPCVPPAEKPQPNVPYHWASPAELDRTGWPAERLAPVRQSLAALRTAYLANDGTAFTAASQALGAATAGLGYPDAAGGFRGMETIDREIRLNRVSPFKRAVWIYCLALLLGLPALVWRRSRVLWLLSLAAVASGLGLHAWGLVERTILSGRAMIGTFYESMLFVAGAAATIGLIFELIFKNRWFSLSAAAGAFGGLWLATRNPDFMQPAISNLRPVLINNDWIHIHVPTIMASYSVLGLAAILAHVWLVTYLFRGERPEGQRSLVRNMFWLIPVGETLLFAGIVLGGIWADASWGRFWGWDPKEVGALIMWLVFMVVVHGRWAGWLRDFGTALGTVIGGWSLAWSYYGTNFFWSGLHSYAEANAGTQIPTWMFIATGVELLLVIPAVILWSVNRAREESRRGRAPEHPTPDGTPPHPQQA